MIFHSDPGTQYTSDEFAKEVIDKYKMIQYNPLVIKEVFMTMLVLNPSDAALKKEEVNHVQYIDYKNLQISDVSIH